MPYRQRLGLHILLQMTPEADRASDNLLACFKWFVSVSAIYAELAAKSLLLSSLTRYVCDHLV